VRQRAAIGRLVLALFVTLAPLALSACSTTGAPVEQTKAVAPPSAWDLSTPESAVRSYLDWTTFAYRMVNSDAATPTMSPEEEVRVNSYVQLNKEANKLINQKLLALTFGASSREGTRAVVPAHESWEYSYLAIDTLRSLSETFTVSYDTTYTLTSPRPGVWVVDSVAATPLGDVK
jgi:hypothetical protein